MIRKPPAGWQQRDEGAAIRTVRTAAAVANGGAQAARRGGHAVAGVVCYFFAAIWGFAGIVGGIAMGSLPSIIGIGAMSALIFWAGRRSFAKARGVAG